MALVRFMLMRHHCTTIFGNTDDQGVRAMIRATLGTYLLLNLKMESFKDQCRGATEERGTVQPSLRPSYRGQAWMVSRLASQLRVDELRNWIAQCICVCIMILHGRVCIVMVVFGD